MARFSILNRKARDGALINLTDHGVQLARLGRLGEPTMLVDRFAELPGANETAVKSWFDESFPDRKGGNLPAFCGFHPPETILVREMINPRRLSEPDYVPSLVADQAKISSAKAWQVGLLHPAEGSTMLAEGPPRAGLLIGLPLQRVSETQASLRAWGVRPRRLEISTVAMFGGLSRHLELSKYANALVVCEIAHMQTRVYLLGKDGIHTPAPLPYGLLSIEEAAMKELGAPDVGAARRQLETPTEALRTHSRRLVRMLSRHLRPAVDYFEMQTGQRIGALFCAGLPESLTWLGPALSLAVDLDYFSPDFPAWLAAAGLEIDSATPVGHSWLQPLSLAAQLAPPPAA